MEKLTQEKIRQVLNCKLATVSRYLTGKRGISLVSALKVRDSLNVPVEIFTDSNEQLKYFGKSFIASENISTSIIEDEVQKTNQKYEV
ncbi:helix-turn-helix transcriptional regulator [Aliarcobacter butzleri]|uniref:helix-turn-helix transcriptional regulator n=1 Tax=Aliarcobacter butzleri TaxID=28197 RepID=UPI002873F7A0|nr:helix-turn-helix transcriptional regulator [Aliarcobacter butzleri]MDS1315794.1 helix-turn-helix transcriptional regulator [Aliarcobacter butzleri]